MLPTVSKICDLSKIGVIDNTAIATNEARKQLREEDESGRQERQEGHPTRANCCYGELPAGESRPAFTVLPSQLTLSGEQALLVTAFRPSQVKVTWCPSRGARKASCCINNGI